MTRIFDNQHRLLVLANYVAELFSKRFYVESMCRELLLEMII